MISFSRTRSAPSGSQAGFSAGSISISIGRTGEKLERHRFSTTRLGAVNRKLVVFVPREALDSVRDALFAAGAGGSATTSGAPGTPRARARSSAARARRRRVGQAGREERVAELRLETVFPAERQDAVVAALREAHPYEEPAFEIYDLVATG